MNDKLSYIKSLQMIHGALLTGQILFCGLAFYLTYNGIVTPIVVPEQTAWIIESALVGFCIVLAYLSFPVYKNKVRALQQSSGTAAQKLTAYRAANIIRWAMMEAPVLLLLVYGMFTGQKMTMIFIAIILLLFILSRPFMQKAVTETGLSDADIENMKG